MDVDFDGRVVRFSAGDGLSYARERRTDTWRGFSPTWFDLFSWKRCRRPVARDDDGVQSAS